MLLEEVPLVTIELCKDLIIYQSGVRKYFIDFFSELFDSSFSLWPTQLQVPGTHECQAWVPSCVMGLKLSVMFGHYNMLCLTIAPIYFAIRTGCRRKIVYVCIGVPVPTLEVFSGYKQ